MLIVEHKNASFAVWITGLPASGKSTIVRALKNQLAERGVDVAVLESDVLRKMFGGDHPYEECARDAFYRQMVFIGSLLYEHGVPVVFDATANRRAYRDRARRQFDRFLEVYLDVPMETCMARDPKGIYRSAKTGEAKNVPGLQDPYESPQSPDLIVHRGDPQADARRIVEKLVEKGYLRLR
jgi:adenylylsulfate kinase